jgi:hypothetical protein
MIHCSFSSIPFLKIYNYIIRNNDIYFFRYKVLTTTDIYIDVVKIGEELVE